MNRYAKLDGQGRVVDFVLAGAKPDDEDGFTFVLDEGQFAEAPPPPPAAAVRQAVIRAGVVVNVIKAPPGHTVPGHTVVATNTAGVGWTYDGNGFSAPAPAAPDVPQEVDPFPFRLALRQLGRYDAVVAWVNSPGNDIAVDAWQSAVKIKRNNPLILAAQAALGLTGAQVDAMFILADKIDGTL